MPKKQDYIAKQYEICLTIVKCSVECAYERIKDDMTAHGKPIMHNYVPIILTAFAELWEFETMRRESNFPVFSQEYFRWLALFGIEPRNNFISVIENSKPDLVKDPCVEKIRELELTLGEWIK